MAKENLADFFRKNSDVAKVSYRTFTGRVQKGTFKTKMEALTTAGTKKGKVNLTTKKVITKSPKVKTVKETKDSFSVNNKEVKKPQGS